MALATQVTLVMRALQLTLGLAPLCLLLGGCGLVSIDPDEIDIADDEIGNEADTAADESNDADGTSSDGGFETETGDTGTEGTTEGTTTEDADTNTGDGDTDTSDATGDVTDSGSDTGTTGGACQDVPPQSACEECLFIECCDLLLTCLDDTVCACTYACYGDGGTVDACAEQCGAPNDPVMLLGECTATSCSDPCL